MAKYYQHALITIAVTDGSEEHRIFPPSLGLSPCNIIELPYRDRKGKLQGCFYVYLSIEPRIEVAYFQAVVCSRLLQRGWVF